MTLIEAIREKMAHGEYEFSEHAVDQSILRHIGVHEVAEAIAGGEVIEEYPHDKYGPSCLIMGFARSGRPIHVQCGYPSGSPVKVITTYEPDPKQWVDCRYRRS
jgi:hypothetical protein